MFAKAPSLRAEECLGQDQEIARTGGRDIPEPDPLAFEFRYIPSPYTSVIGRLDPENRDRELFRPAVMHDAGFGFWRAGHVNRELPNDVTRRLSRYPLFQRHCSEGSPSISDSKDKALTAFCWLTHSCVRCEAKSHPLL
jgi:hypothetical protein